MKTKRVIIAIIVLGVPPGFLPSAQGLTPTGRTSICHDPLDNGQLLHGYVPGEKKSTGQFARRGRTHNPRRRCQTRNTG